MEEELADAFNDWLDAHFEPDRTRKGNVRRRLGVVCYPWTAQKKIKKLLGGAFTMSSVRRARAGRDVSPRLRSAIRRIVELDDPETIRARVRDEQLASALRHGRRIHSISGNAPDGGRLEAWALRRLRRLNEQFETDAPIEGEAAELWGELMGMPRANRRRRRRRSKEGAHV